MERGQLSSHRDHGEVEDSDREDEGEEGRVRVGELLHPLVVEGLGGGDREGEDAGHDPGQLEKALKDGINYLRLHHLHG